MKLNKKISALLSCILACSAINPSASAVTDYDEIDDTDDESGYYYGNSKEKEDSESDSIAILDIIKPILIGGAIGVTFYGGYKGVKAGQRYHARNMLKGEAWEWTMSGSDKKLLYDTILSLKAVATKRGVQSGDINGGLDRDSQGKENTDDYTKLQFNISKLHICDAELGKYLGENYALTESIKHIFRLVTGQNVEEKKPLGELLHESEVAVGYINDIFKGNRTINNLTEDGKEHIEENKKIIEFMDKIGFKDCVWLLRNCGNIQTDENPDPGTNELKIKWYKHANNLNVSPYRTITFENPDIVLA